MESHIVKMQEIFANQTNQYPYCMHLLICFSSSLLSAVLDLAFHIVSRHVYPFCIQVFPSHSITHRVAFLNPLTRTH